MVFAVTVLTVPRCGFFGAAGAQLRPAQQELLRETWQRSGVSSWELVTWQHSMAIFSLVEPVSAGASLTTAPGFTTKQMPESDREMKILAATAGATLNLEKLSNNGMNKYKQPIFSLQLNHSACKLLVNRVAG